MSGFDGSVLDVHRLEIAQQANLGKFGQNPNLRSFLLVTGNKMLAEASPYDQIWGIGFRAEDPRAYQPSLWKGYNLLGRLLISV